MLLNTSKFNLIVDYFKLSDVLNYYKLFNESPYRNSYHGYMHVMKFICSLFELSKTSYFNTTYSQLRCMMIAAIFHDFNYIAYDANNVDYDKLNIEAALEAFKAYMAFQSTDANMAISSCSADFILKLIADTEYPKCMKVKLDRLSNIFVECDHSMIIHKNYHIQSFQFQINEFKQTVNTKESIFNIRDSIKNYLNSVHFESPLFLNIFNKNKQDIIKLLDDWYYSLEYYKPMHTRINWMHEQIRQATIFI